MWLLVTSFSTADLDDQDRRSDGAWARSAGFNTGIRLAGELRQDPSPCWNRESDRILVPAIREDATSRQLFVNEVDARERGQRGR